MVALSIAAGLLAGCSTAGTPVAKVVPTGPEGTSVVPYQQNPLAVAELPDPCVVSDEVLKDAGLDPSSASGRQYSMMRSCGWDIPQVPNNPIAFIAMVYVSKASFDQELKSTTRTNRKTVEVGPGRNAVLADGTLEPVEDNSDAIVTWGTQFGTISVEMDLIYNRGPRSFDTRAKALEFARDVYKNMQ
ncbi:DUF3558 family protein [Gordonia araii]|uniref:DUF3558 family protein n=1 Tax=Gordonia araii TaxID=263909 RepID=UPI001478F081|nr:DUF3558 family protein [Gordonia araii]NNG97970.1 DUF3558 family protein [Gordonia araii NBRC 100433]